MRTFEANSSSYFIVVQLRTAFIWFMWGVGIGNLKVEIIECSWCCELWPVATCIESNCILRAIYLMRFEYVKHDNLSYRNNSKYCAEWEWGAIVSISFHGPIVCRRKMYWNLFVDVKKFSKYDRNFFLESKQFRLSACAKNVLVCT